MVVTLNSGKQSRGIPYKVDGEVTTLYCPDKNGVYHEVLIDTEDLDRVATRFWKVANFYPQKTNRQHRLYAYSNDPRPNKRTVYLHRFVTNCPPGFEVDHSNHDSLDNRRSVALRVVTHAENQANKLGYVWVKHVKQPTRPCAHCGSEFQPSRSTHKFCSRPCMWQGRRNPISKETV